MSNAVMLTNMCTKTRIETADKHVIQLFSAFYSHPAMLTEDSWHLVKSGTLPILVDQDTMEIMKDLECEWGFDSKSDVILSLKLRCHITDPGKRKELLKHKLEYAKRTRGEIEHFFDKQKVEDLTKSMEETTICSERAVLDDCKNSPKLERIPEVIE